jgi:hypothetical protein
MPQEHPLNQRFQKWKPWPTQRAAKIFLEATEKWADNKETELLLILKGNINLQT